MSHTVLKPNRKWITNKISQIKISSHNHNNSHTYNPFHSAKNKKYLLDAIEDYKAGRNIVRKTMAELEAMENV